MAEFINPRVDWAFKRIFGSEDTKECLITFLNGLFAGEFEITDVKFVPVEQTKTNEDERGVIFDVKCITADGRHVIVEMQKKSQEYFVDRALFYTSKAIVGQGKKGKWNFRLAPVYTVCFMDFRAKNSIPRQFRTDIGLGLLKEVKAQVLDCKQGAKVETLQTVDKVDAKQTVKVDADPNVAAAGRKSFELSGLKYGFEKMRMVFLQLPLFKKKKQVECMDIFDCWIYIIKNMEKLKEMPFIDKYPVFRKLAEIGDLRKLTPEEREYYDEDIKAMRDLYAIQKWEEKQKRMEMEAATKRATKKGLKQGMQQGLQQGLQQGIKQGMQQGMQQGLQQGALTKSLEIASKLLSSGMSDAQILQYTGLTQGQLESIKS